MTTLCQRLNDARPDQLCKLMAGQAHIGYLRPHLAHLLAAHAPHLFGQTAHDTLDIVLHAPTPEALTRAFSELHDDLAAAGTLPRPAGERVDIRTTLDAPALCSIDRNLIFPLGLLGRGVHAALRYDNGDFVVARRSHKVFTFRDCFDISVGGLLPSGAEPWQHVCTEAAEEGGITASDLRVAGDAIVLRYMRNVEGTWEGETYKPAYPFETDGGTNWDEVFCWTVTIPDSAVPHPVDGEVKSFTRMTPQDMLHSLRTQPEAWKTNSGVLLLAALAQAPDTAPLLTAQERQELSALLVADPRPLARRSERALMAPATQPPRFGHHG